MTSTFNQNAPQFVRTVSKKMGISIGAGATRFIAKPFRMVELPEEVQLALV
ncbi:MAG: hypothetical protein H0X41_00510 [Chitinophagaceae bacterium]|nr:hypothetical protein [Chitinophagaceae bacterium]